MNSRMILFHQIDESDGSLVYMETLKDIPIEIKRTFYIFSTPEGATRANHANKTTDFVMISLNGCCKITTDDGKEKHVFTLNDPKSGIYVPKMTWIQASDFSLDCILLIFANEIYEKKKYIDNYDDFMNECKLLT